MTPEEELYERTRLTVLETCEEEGAGEDEYDVAGIVREFLHDYGPARFEWALNSVEQYQIMRRHRW